jgi:chemotaxis signal transduction protein
VSLRLPTPILALNWATAAAGDGPRWLLPAAAVLEVTRCPTPAPLPLPLDTDPRLAQALLGTFAWRGRRLPLLHLDASLAGQVPAGASAPAMTGGDAGVGVGDDAGGDADSDLPLRLRAVICPSLREDAIDAFALAALGMPGLLTLREGEVDPYAETGMPPPFCTALLRAHGELFAVPDMDALAAALAPVSALMA